MISSTNNMNKINECQKKQETKRKDKDKFKQEIKPSKDPKTKGPDRQILANILETMKISVKYQVIELEKPKKEQRILKSQKLY